MRAVFLHYHENEKGLTFEGWLKQRKREKWDPPGADRSPNSDSEGSFVEIPVKRRGSSAEEARRVDGFVRMRRQTIVAMVHLPILAYP